MCDVTVAGIVGGIWYVCMCDATVAGIVGGIWYVCVMQQSLALWEEYGMYV